MHLDYSRSVIIWSKRHAGYKITAGDSVERAMAPSHTAATEAPVLGARRDKRGARVAWPLWLPLRRRPDRRRPDVIADAALE